MFKFDSWDVYILFCVICKLNVLDIFSFIYEDSFLAESGAMHHFIWSFKIELFGLENKSWGLAAPNKGKAEKLVKFNKLILGNSIFVVPW
jgi:hypothetical protein